MDREWDLFAIVRECSGNVFNPTAVNEPFPSFPSDLPPPVYDEQNSLGFPALGDGMNKSYDHDLQEIYHNFRYGNQVANPNPTAAAGGTGAFAASIMPAVNKQAFALQPRQGFMQIRNNVFVSPAVKSPPQNLSAEALLQLTKKGRRKNYQPKLIRQMTKDELNTDSWAWRKYGQKPIKGFENPRCYYKCSTSKGCSARKQVELYSRNPDSYVVTYSGEHTHPRPTRRNSLAGSTRIRFANPSGARNGGRAKRGASTSMTAAAPPPPPAAASFSPDTPSTESESMALFDDLSKTDVYGGAAGYEENIAMLANALLNDDDDFFEGLNDSDDFPGDGDFFSEWSFGGGSFDGNGGF